MRFWRSIGLLVLVLGIVASPAHSAAKKKKEKPVATAKVSKPRKVKAPKASAPSDSTKVAKAKGKKAHAPGSRVPDRRAWMMGLGAGWSSVIFRGAGTFDFAAHPRVPIDAAGNFYRVYPQPVFGTKDKDSGLTNVISVGYAILPTFAIGMQRLNWTNGETLFNRWDIGVSAVTATWYPRATAWYVRLGAGPANATSTPGFVNTVARAGGSTGPFIDKTRYTDDGFGGLAAVGFEWNLFGRLCLAPEIHGVATTLDRHVSSVAAGADLSVNWWF